MKQLDARLSKLEAVRAAALERDPVADWLASFRRGDDIAARNAGAGPAWCAMAAERERLAIETMVTYEQNDD